MNILHICSITNNKVSGMSNVVPDHFLNQKKYENVAIFNCNKTRLKQLNYEKNVYYIDNINSISKLPQPFNKPDIAVFHGVYIPTYLRLSKELRREGIPYVIIPHGSLTYEAQQIKFVKKYVANKLLFNNFIYGAISIQYLSIGEKEASSRFEVDPFVIGNGIKVKEEINHTFSNEGLKLIYIGRYAVYTKGLDLLVNLVDRNYQFFLKNGVTIDLYGTGADGREKVASLLNNNTQKIIKVNDAIFDIDKDNALMNHDAFIQMSRHEAQPLAIMEAMSYALPVIASSGTTFGNLIELNQCGVNADVDEDVVRFLKDIIKDKNYLLQISKNSYMYALNNFDWNRVAKDTIMCYLKRIQ